MAARTEELELHLHAETEQAWCVSTDGDGEQSVWLPKSQVERGRRTGRRDPVYMFDVPLWLAEKEDLV